MRVIISRCDVMREMEKLSPSVPCSAAFNIALAATFARCGLKFKQRGLFGFSEPELDPPWEVFLHFGADGWDITQGGKP